MVAFGADVMDSVDELFHQIGCLWFGHTGYVETHDRPQPELAKQLLKTIEDVDERAWEYAKQSHAAAAHFAIGCAVDCSIAGACEPGLAVAEGVPGSSASAASESPAERALSATAARLSPGEPIWKQIQQITEMLGLEDEAGNPQKVRKAEQMLSLPSSGRLIERVGRIQRELGSKSSSWALHHWQVAAQRDYGPALCMLGECRANGYLVDEDPDIAAEYYWRAASQGVLQAGELLKALVQFSELQPVAMPHGCRVRFRQLDTGEGSPARDCIAVMTNSAPSGGRYGCRLVDDAAAELRQVDLTQSGATALEWEVVVKGATPWAELWPDKTMGAREPVETSPVYSPSTAMARPAQSARSDTESQRSSAEEDLRASTISRLRKDQSPVLSEAEAVLRESDELSAQVRELMTPTPRRRSAIREQDMDGELAARLAQVNQESADLSKEVNKLLPPVPETRAAEGWRGWLAAERGWEYAEASGWRFPRWLQWRALWLWQLLWLFPHRNHRRAAVAAVAVVLLAVAFSLAVDDSSLARFMWSPSGADAGMRMHRSAPRGRNHCEHHGTC